MASIVVLGAGQMGSALTVPLTDNGHQVHLVGSFLETERIETLRTTRTHDALGCNLPEGVRLYMDEQLEGALEQAALVVVAVHSLGIDWAGMVLGFALPPGTPVVLASRGMSAEGDELQTAAEALRAQLLETTPVITLAGPLLAHEVAARRPGTALIAGSDNSDLATVGQWLQSDQLHVVISNDWRGVSVSSGLVNLYALAVCMGNSLAAEAALFARSQVEMIYLLGQWGGVPETAVGLAGAGDLFATAGLPAPVGRHRALGELLGRGLKYADAVRQIPGVTIEGAELALAIGASVERQVRAGELDGTRIPLLRTMIDIICNDGSVPAAMINREW